MVLNGGQLYHAILDKGSLSHSLVTDLPAEKSKSPLFDRHSEFTPDLCL